MKEAPNHDDAKEPTRIEIANISALNRGNPLAVLAVIVASLAMFVALWQGYLTREHNRLSLRPHLDLTWYFTGSSKSIGMSLSNDGAGPAAIKWIQLYIKNEAVWSGDGNAWPKVFDRFDISLKWAKYYHFESGSVLPPGREVVLFGFDRSQYGRNQWEVFNIRREAIRGALLELRIGLCYCSFYQECWYLEDGYRQPSAYITVATCLGEPTSFRQKLRE